MSKHKYDKSEITQSEDFELDDYVNRDLFRQEKAKERAEKMVSDRIKIRQICNESGFIEVCELVNYIVDNAPELQNSLFEDFYIWRSFIDSNSKLNRLNSKLQQRIDELESALLNAKNTIDDYRQSYTELKKADLELRKYVCELGGESQLEIIDKGMDGWESLPSDSDD